MRPPIRRRDWPAPALAPSLWMWKRSIVLSSTDNANIFVGQQISFYRGTQVVENRIYACDVQRTDVWPESIENAFIPMREGQETVGGVQKKRTACCSGYCASA
ncbi:unnamed protein product [Ixodes persulcatus]